MLTKTDISAESVIRDHIYVLDINKVSGIFVPKNIKYIEVSYTK